MPSRRQERQPDSSSLQTGHRGAPAPIACSPEKLSELIGGIYDCVLDPTNWEPVLASINREFNFAVAALGVVPFRPGGHTVNISVGADQDWLEVTDSDAYRAASLELWGGPACVQQFPLDEPIVRSQLPAFRTRHTNRYFCDFLEPRGIFDALTISLAREPQLLGYVVFSRHVSAGEVREAEVNALRLLGPHFRRAVTISNLFDMKAIEAATFSSVLDGLALGLVLVDPQLGIVHANAVASELLAARDPIESQRGFLATRQLAANGALERAVRLASDDETAMGARGIGIPARRANGESCVIHVLPLRRGEMRRGLSQRATAALFVVPATAPAQVPADALALLYDLTPAEKRICELIADGETQSAIALTLGIARGTVKTRVLRIFDKTGCKRQLDLVKLVNSLRLPV
jgi:DNA-binding CsgD family transcriptional regulator